MKHVTQWSAVAVLLGGCLIGCEPVVKIQPKPPIAGFTVPASRADSTAVLAEDVGPFDADVLRLPGVTAEDHRQTLVLLLDRLPKMLELANGSEMSPEFSNGISVITAAHATISDASVERRRMEAVENQALQSAASACGEITTRYLWDDDQLPPLLQSLNNAVTVAADSVGTMHDLDATYAFEALQAVMGRIAFDMGERFSPPTAQ
jgi:hypothetical protein